MTDIKGLVKLLKALHKDIRFTEGFGNTQLMRSMKEDICAVFSESMEDLYDGFIREKMNFCFLMGSGSLQDAAELFGKICTEMKAMLPDGEEIESAGRGKPSDEGGRLKLTCYITTARRKCGPCWCRALEGETIWDTAARTGVYADELLRLNPWLDGFERFEGGEKIRI